MATRACVMPARAAPVPTRLAWAIVLGMVLALRLLGTTGYMPAFERGAVSIIPCPDADANAPLALGTAQHHHHHGKAKHGHNPCPYAAASALGALGADLATLGVALMFVMALAPVRALALARRSGSHERPPAIGPPLPA